MDTKKERLELNLKLIEGQILDTDINELKVFLKLCFNWNLDVPKYNNSC